ncbi:hypothetical protein NE865_09035 [Phthorimaea operculella]|nr:hypothetical protein NE865_09035 [Phthorimaea operculella]
MKDSESGDNNNVQLPESVSSPVSITMAGGKQSSLEFIQVTKPDGSLELIEQAPKNESGKLEVKADIHQPNGSENVKMDIDKTSSKRLREEDEEGFEKVLSQREKKLFKMQESIEIYIYCKEKMPKQFALAKLFKEQGIVGVNKIKYLNPYKIRVEAKDEVLAGQIMLCRKFEDLNWRFQRALEVDVSYGVIKGVDLDLTDAEIHESISCPEPAMLVAAKRLRKRDINGAWVNCEAVRLAFKGTIVPTHIYVDQLRIAVEPYVFPVTQCSRCWKLGHTAGRCTSKNIVCPKCSGEHENCTVKVFKCVNCSQNHMALERRKCPVFLKEKTIRELMSEFRCSYRMALLMYVKPESPLIQNKPSEPTCTNPTQQKNPESPVQASPIFTWAAKSATKKSGKGSGEEKPKNPRGVQGSKLRTKVDRDKKEEDWWSMGAASETVDSDLQWEKPDRRREDT